MSSRPIPLFQTTSVSAREGRARSSNGLPLESSLRSNPPYWPLSFQAEGFSSHGEGMEDADAGLYLQRSHPRQTRASAMATPTIAAINTALQEYGQIQPVDDIAGYLTNAVYGLGQAQPSTLLNTHRLVPNYC